MDTKARVPTQERWPKKRVVVELNMPSCKKADNNCLSQQSVAMPLQAHLLVYHGVGVDSDMSLGHCIIWCTSVRHSVPRSQNRGERG